MIYVRDPGGHDRWDRVLLGRWFPHHKKYSSVEKPRRTKAHTPRCGMSGCLAGWNENRKEKGRLLPHPRRKTGSSSQWGQVLLRGIVSNLERDPSEQGNGGGSLRSGATIITLRTIRDELKRRIRGGRKTEFTREFSLEK